jgi:hypothetical protein
MNEQSGGTVSGQEKRRSELQAFWATQRPKHFCRYRKEYVGEMFKDKLRWAKGLRYLPTKTCRTGFFPERKNKPALADLL